MEARWNGKTLDEALAAAIGDSELINEAEYATLAGLVTGYYRRYDDTNECIGSLAPEREFRYALKGSLTFDTCGKIDGLGWLKDGRSCLLEHKTAGEDIGTDADYWLRLRFNPQIYQYVEAARECGFNIDTIIYDVTRKPMIRPYESIPTLDADGLKQVIGADGNRVFKRDGSPKQTADKEKGEAVLSAPETLMAYAERLAEDCAARPEFYFARREVAVLDDDLDQFRCQRLNVARMILHFRASARKQRLPEFGWPRNCNGITCRMCEFENFCMQNVHVSAESVPAGFVIGQVNPELNNA
jgi:hypothetical protein